MEIVSVLQEAMAVAKPEQETLMEEAWVEQLLRQD